MTMSPQLHYILHVYIDVTFYMARRHVSVDHTVMWMFKVWHASHIGIAD